MRVRVDGIVPAPDVGVILLERPRSAADPRVAEQDASWPDCARLFARFGPALFAGDVELAAKRVGAVTAPHGSVRSRACPVDVGEAHLAALPEQPPARRDATPPSTPANQCALPWAPVPF